jgi:hypothetical protein
VAHVTWCKKPNTERVNVTSLNFKDLSKAVKNEFIEGLPKLDKIEKTLCGPYKMGKQLKA